jgi:hypothetical protein
MTARREVRVTDDFFDDLDRQLGNERGPNGEPSTTDFLTMEMPAIVERFALEFDLLPVAYPDESLARVAVGTGLLVSALAVYGFELADGSVELVGLDVEL